MNKSRNRIKQKKIEKNVDLVNEDIKFENILLVSENGNQMINTKDALSTAREKNLDLFCVSAKTEPPVCKILDYKKYIFDLNKNKKIKKDNSPKEIRISPNIGDNDLKVKLGRIGKWTEMGFSVKVEIFMSGKEKIYPEIALQKCEYVVQKLKNEFPKLEVKDGIKSHLNVFYFFISRKKN